MKAATMPCHGSLQAMAKVVVLALVLALTGCAGSTLVIRSYAEGLAGVRRANHALRLSVSFMDRNRVAYTSWSDLRGGVWQTVRIAFEQIRPNPYFQPPGAQTGAPLDVSEVKAIGFAPQGPGPGRIALSRFVIVD